MNKKKLRSSIKIWLLSIATLFIVAIATIVTSNNKVKAQHVDSTTGNIVSDTIADVENLQLINECGITLTNNSGLITINGTTNCIYQRSYGSYNFPVGTYAYNDFRSSSTNTIYTGFVYSNGWQYGLEGSPVNNGQVSATTTSTMLQYRFYIPSGVSFSNFKLRPMLVKGSTIPTTYEPYGEIYYYSPQAYENKENFYFHTIENIYYKKYPNADDRVDQNITSGDYRTSNGYLGFNNIISGVPNNTDLKDIFINTNQYYTNLNNLRIVFDNTYTNQVEYLKNSYVSLECIAIADINNYDYTTIHSCPISEGNYNNIDNLTVNLYTLYSYDQGGNLLNYFLNNGYPGLDTIGFKYNRIHFTFSEVSNTIPDSGQYVGAVVRGIQVSSVYNASYQEGYASGLLTNKGNVDKAYNDGYNVGKNKGYNDGYQAGSDINRGNTLVGLADTILTSPINMFETIFDFNFLGINLGAFFLSLVSLLVVIWLIKRMI